MQSDPIGLRAGFSTYGYVSEKPTSDSDPLGLISQCRSGLDALRNIDLPLLHHEYLCWTDSDGKEVCRGYGQAADSNKGQAITGYPEPVKGIILKDKENGAGKCESDDKNKCMDKCAEKKWKELEISTPDYSWFGSGSQCLRVKRDVYDFCRKECQSSDPLKIKPPEPSLGG